MTPSWPQDGPKIGSKHLEPVWNQFGTKTSWFQTGSKLVPNWFQTFGTSLEPVWNQNELVPNWFQTGSKLVWNQFGTSLEPKRVGSKLVWNQLVLVPNWFQTGSKVDFDT